MTSSVPAPRTARLRRPGYRSTFGVLFATVALAMVSLDLALLPTGWSAGSPADAPGPGGVARWTMGQTSLTTPNFTITFGEGGLPVGTNWSVTCNGTTVTSPSPQINFSEPSGNYTYSVAPEPGFDAINLAGYILVQSHNAFAGFLFTPHTYVLTFAETGLPTNWTWVVFLGTQYKYSSTSTVTFKEPNGTYSFQIAQGDYVPSPLSGTVNLTGANATVNVTFVYIPPPVYPVTFSETGLVTGSSWSVRLNGTLLASTASVIVFQEQNGLYPFSVGLVGASTPAPGSGMVFVSGPNINLSIAFHPPPKYNVTLLETGLPAGTNWSVGLNGTSQFTTSSSTTFLVPNGSYAYALGRVPGWTTLRFVWAVSVTGSPVTLTIAWTRVTYIASFRESGLVAGTAWSSEVNGTWDSSATSGIVVSEPNGTYPFTRPAAVGYELISAPPSPLVIDGTDVQLAVTFTLAVQADFYVEGGAVAGTCDPLTEIVTLIASPSGGVTPYNNLTWSFGPGSPLAYGPSTQHTFGAFGGNATLRVVDAAGYNSSFTQGIGRPVPPGCPIEVTNPPPPPGIYSEQLFGLPGAEGYALLGVILAAMVGGAATVLAWEGRRHEPPHLPL